MAGWRPITSLGTDDLADLPGRDDVIHVDEQSLDDAVGLGIAVNEVVFDDDSGRRGTVFLVCHEKADHAEGSADALEREKIS